MFLLASIGFLGLLLGVSVGNPVTKRLHNGTLLFSSGVTMVGTPYYTNGTDGILTTSDQASFVYYGYKYGIANRFEDSVANTDFTYLSSASRPLLGDVCPEFPDQKFPNQDVIYSEDCLFLDIYVPPIKKNQANTWPVFIWIHGGSFKTQSKNMYNATILCPELDAIVVTVNYRKTAFGFLSTGDSAARGNWALGDLKLALKFVLDNAAAFNGDPTRVSIVGESAGGPLTSALMLDNEVRGSVYSATAMSSSMMRPWTLRKDMILGVTEMAAYLGCSTTSTDVIVACLKTQSIINILNASLIVLENSTNSEYIFYAPVIDGYHITKEPAKMLEERAHERISGRIGNFISGTLGEEYSFFLTQYPTILAENFTLDHITTLMTSFLLQIGEEPCAARIPAMLTLLYENYGIDSSSAEEVLRYAYYHMSSESMFWLGTYQESILYAKSGNGHNNQMYKVLFNPGFMDLGAFHSMDFMHLFRGTWDAYFGALISNAFSKALWSYFNHVVYHGRAPGPWFSQHGKYLQLNQTCDWNPVEDFHPRLAFWRTLNELPCPV